MIAELMVKNTANRMRKMLKCKVFVAFIYMQKYCTMYNVHMFNAQLMLNFSLLFFNKEKGLMNFSGYLDQNVNYLDLKVSILKFC